MSRLSEWVSGLGATAPRAIVTGTGLLALGLIAAGGLVGNGMVRMKRADREVTVRGVAQRQVTANQARWEARYSARAFALPDALAAVDRHSAIIAEFVR